jgi:hypothetical protein
MDTDRRGRGPSRRRPGHLLGSTLLLWPLALLGPGCKEAAESSALSRRAITPDGLPAPVLKAAKKAVPGVEYREAWKNVDRAGSVMSFEVRGRSRNGKIRAVRLSPTGEVLDTE